MEKKFDMEKELFDFETYLQSVNIVSSWPRVLLVDLARKQCNGIIKGWLHCLESIGRFLVSNILMFDSAWCLVMAQIQFSLIKKNKDWTSSTLANPPFPASNNISFLAYPPSPYPFKVDVICVSPLSWDQTLLIPSNDFSTLITPFFIRASKILLRLNVLSF